MDGNPKCFWEACSRPELLCVCWWVWVHFDTHEYAHGVLGRQANRFNKHQWSALDYHEAYIQKRTTPLEVAHGIIDSLRQAKSMNPPMIIFAAFDPDDLIRQAKESTDRWLSLHAPFMILLVECAYLARLSTHVFSRIILRTVSTNLSVLHPFADLANSSTKIVWRVN